MACKFFNDWKRELKKSASRRRNDYMTVLFLSHINGIILGYGPTPSSLYHLGCFPVAATMGLRLSRGPHEALLGALLITVRQG